MADKPNVFIRGLATLGYVTLPDPESEPSPSEKPAAPRAMAPAPYKPVAPPVYSGVPGGGYVPAAPIAPALTPEQAARIQKLDKDAEGRLLHVMANDGAPRVEELMEVLETLVEAIPDERARYVAALKLLAKRGSPVPVILQDYTTCLAALDANYKQFESELQGAVTRKVGSKIQAVETYNKQLEAKAQQIAALQQEMTQIAAQRDQEQAGISEEEQNIELVKSRFNLVFTSMRGAISQQQDRVANFGAGL